MHKVKVRVPATITSVGPGIHTLGLAVSLHSRIALQVRSDSKLSVMASGDETDKIPENLDNLALRAAIRVFQQIENAPAGLHVEVHNAIPFGYGFGEDVAQVVGGIVAAHNLIDSPLSRDELIKVALTFNLPYEAVVAAMMGSLSLCSLEPDEPHTLAYTSAELPPTQVVIVAPQFDTTGISDVRFPKQIMLNDAVRLMRQSVLLANALQYSDYELIRRTFAFQVHQAQYASVIPHLEAVQEIVANHENAAVTVAGRGNVFLAFAEEEQHALADEIVSLYSKHHIQCRRWVLPIDRQGVVISELEPAEEQEMFES